MIKHKGRVFDFVCQQIKLPNGLSKSYDFVSHRGAVVIIPFLTMDKVILIRQFRPVLGKYVYEFPAGSIDKGEKPADCAKRELIEEIGYKAARMQPLGDIIPCAGYSTEILKAFKATGLLKTETSSEEDEIIEPLVKTRAQIRKMFKDGKIIDAKTIVCLAKIGWI